ncbi:hypothetical protein [Bradyrhizobium erythrophlei]|uniref:Uncharacterized protein n=1 Tax=Bradyrhizobium erythrophlei TaxID=1437360 RepID=A0A1H4NHJ5_9BRAD|nr:hypothetical protein [Bradyrhizobium erythrophlei]SEB94723.1 hypothetical protein SAMN05444164_0633 [Bradyrhizobium erythrophlei]
MSIPSPVQVTLARQYLEAHNLFGRWATVRKLPVLPTMPVYIADFVSNSFPAAKLEELIRATEEVSRLHTGNGLADPVTGQVASAFQAIAPIAPPRSWPTEHKTSFLQLPYGLQKYVAAHESRSEKEVRRAQSEAAAARQKLREAGKTNGDQQNVAA